MVASEAGNADGFDLAMIFLCLTREEPTEDFFGFCGLFTFVFETCLFAFFDGDTVDLHCGCAAVVWITGGDGHQHVQAFDNLAKDGVAIIQMRGGNMRDKEL